MGKVLRNTKLRFKRKRKLPLCDRKKSQFKPFVRFYISAISWTQIRQKIMLRRERKRKTTITKINRNKKLYPPPLPAFSKVCYVMIYRMRTQSGGSSDGLAPTTKREVTPMTIFSDDMPKLVLIKNWPCESNTGSRKGSNTGGNAGYSGELSLGRWDWWVNSAAFLKASIDWCKY